MSSLEKSSLPKDEVREIEIRELQPLLQKSFKDDRLQIINLKASRLLPMGENYCSLLVKIDMTIKKSDCLKEDKLYLVAKMMSKSERCFVNWVDVFEKEVFIYAELLPAYRDLERKVGVNECDLINILPTYIGSRNSLSENDKIIDYDSLLLMDNLKMKGYESGNRFVGLDADHAQIALEALARYHALGIALKQNKPEFFKKAVTQAQILSGDFDLVKEGLDCMLKTIKEEFNTNKNIPWIETRFNNVMSTLLHPPEEPWGTITHGDFWVNNILFHKDEHGKVDDVKFVDFQTYRYHSPLKDVLYFFCGSLDSITLHNHFDQLLDVYYDCFVKTLNLMGCNTKPFSKSAFNRDLKKQASDDFPWIAFVTKFFVYEVKDHEENNKLVNKVYESECSSSYKKKLHNLIDLYEQRSWFEE